MSDEIISLEEVIAHVIAPPTDAEGGLFSHYEPRFRALLTEGGAKVLFHHGLEHQRGGELRSRTLPTVSAL